jgi:putative DNA primase/helicase
MTPAERVAKALGDPRREGGAWRCNCPLHGGHSLIVNDGREGRLLVKCWGADCSTVLIFRVLRWLRLLDGDTPTLETLGAVEARQAEEARDRRRRIAAALDLWGECRSAAGTIVERYLRSRGLTEPIPPTIRMHGMMRHRESGGRRPAMVALVEHVKHGPVGVHLTYLAIDGSMKAAVEPCRRSLGPVAGGAVRCAHVLPDRELAVGEGLETVLSVMQATGLPGWAALSAVGIRNLVLPAVARSILIAADNDANGTGECAARDAARRWMGGGRRARIAMPAVPGTDFNDVLRGCTYARVAEVVDVAV